MDKQLFTQWICDHLCPALTKGQHVIMDNASIHKDIKIKEAIEKVGCTCHLSKSSSADYQRGVQRSVKYNGLMKTPILHI